VDRRGAYFRYAQVDVDVIQLNWPRDYSGHGIEQPFQH